MIRMGDIFLHTFHFLPEMSLKGKASIDILLVDNNQHLLVNCHMIVSVMFCQRMRTFTDKLMLLAELSGNQYFRFTSILITLRLCHISSLCLLLVIMSYGIY